MSKSTRWLHMPGKVSIILPLSHGTGKIDIVQFLCPEVWGSCYNIKRWKVKDGKIKIYLQLMTAIRFTFVSPTFSRRLSLFSLTDVVTKRFVRPVVTLGFSKKESLSLRFRKNRVTWSYRTRIRLLDLQIEIVSGVYCGCVPGHGYLT